MFALFLLFLLKSIDCGYSLEPPRRGGSNEYHNLCFEQKYEKYQNILSENLSFLMVKFSVYLNRRVFVMRQMSRNVRKRSFGHVRPANIQISLRIRAVYLINLFNLWSYESTIHPAKVSYIVVIALNPLPFQLKILHTKAKWVYCSFGLHMNPYIHCYGLGKTVFAWRFILNDNTLFCLTISYQKTFVFSVSVF